MLRFRFGDFSFLKSGKYFLKRHMLQLTCWKKNREKFVNRSTRSFSAFPHSAPRLLRILHTLLLVPGPHQCILNVFYCHQLGFFCIWVYRFTSFRISKQPPYLGRFLRRLNVLWRFLFSDFGVSMGQRIDPECYSHTALPSWETCIRSRSFCTHSGPHGWGPNMIRRGNSLC